MGKTHTLVAVVDKWGEVRLDLQCPFEVGEDRPCKMGMEPDRCDWQDYEIHGAHHDSCPAAKDRNAPCVVDDGVTESCWPEPPEECDGWYSDEVGHIHETKGCWARELISELGWDEAVRWEHREEATLTLPAQVTVWCDDEDGVTMGPVK